MAQQKQKPQGATGFSASVIAILRGVEEAFFSEIMAVSFAAGLTALEVTMNTKDAERIIARNRDQVPAGCYLGMGTVCTVEEAKRAVGCGAMFLVSPNFDPRVIAYARSMDVPIVAGALTPTEIHAAWTAGADMIKVFPCNAVGGARYIRDLRGPYASLPLVAVGGVTSDTLEAYFAAGVNGVGVSAALFGKEALLEKDVPAIGRNVKKFIDHCRQIQDRLKLPAC
jgi:2-dehydro-3-deoxyphosphogluconate aldolase/(4S)-4-hydroxy-2-oxoglutarate aldolase